jgi:hypothetical protein
MNEEEREQFIKHAEALASHLLKVLPENLPLQLERQYLELKEAMEDVGDTIPGYQVTASMIAGYVVQSCSDIKNSGQLSKGLTEIAMTAYVLGYNIRRIEREIIESKLEDDVLIKNESENDGV